MGMDRELDGDRESEKDGGRDGDMDRERERDGNRDRDNDREREGDGDRDTVCGGGLVQWEDSQGPPSVAMGPSVSLSHLSLAGEEKRIREFYQSRGLDRVTQPSGDGGTGGHGGQAAAVLGGVRGTGG